MPSRASLDLHGVSPRESEWLPIGGVRASGLVSGEWCEGDGAAAQKPLGIWEMCSKSLLFSCEKRSFDKHFAA